MIDDLVKKIPAGKYEGSSVIEGIMYHDLPYTSLSHLKSHRGGTIDRVKQITDHIDVRDKTVLDIGCSVGGISLGLALDGAKKVTGVDYDEESITVARKACEDLGLTQIVKFEKQVIDKKWAETLPHVDVVIWLSQWMWLAKQVGADEAKEILFIISGKAKEMAFESAADDGMAGVQGLTQEDVHNWLIEFTPFKKIITLPPLPGWMGRNVFILKEKKNIVKHLSENIEDYNKKGGGKT